MPDRVTMDEQAMLNRERARAWRAVMIVSAHMGDYDQGGFVIMQITLQSPLHTGGDYRGIVKGTTETGQKSIAFVNGPDVGAVLEQIANGLRDNGLRWKEDVPYDQRKVLGEGKAK